MAQKSPYRAESAVLLRGAAGTSGAQKLATRPTGGPEEGTTATGGAQRAEGVELGKSDAQWPAAYGCGCGVSTLLGFAWSVRHCGSSDSLKDTRHHPA